MKKLLILAMMVSFGLVIAPVGAQVKVEKWSPDVAGGADPTAVYTAAQTITDVFTLPTFGLGAFGRADVDLNYTMRQTGYILITTGGTYKFGTTSDDGSFLWIGDWWTPMGETPVPVKLGMVKSMPLTLVVNNDFYQGMTLRTGLIDLTPGLYGIMVGFYQGGGGLGLTCQYGGPDTGYADILIPAGPLAGAALTAPVAPADGAINVAAGAQLSWVKSPLIAVDISYKLFFGPGSGEPNMVKIYEGKDTTKAPVPSPLAASTKYFWRVDVVDPNNGKPLTYKGVEWSFTVESGKPIITTQPVKAVVGADCEGTFTIVAKSGADGNFGALSYAWKKAGNAATLGTADTFSIAATTANVGMYYCDVTNSKGTTTSAEAELKVLGKGADLANISIGTGVGTAGVGTTIHSADSVTVVGSGDDIWNAADGFQYAYVQVSGDFDVSARVTSFSCTDAGGWAKGGIMARQDLTVGSAHVFVAATAANGFSMQGRRNANTGDNGNHSGQGGLAGAYPFGMAQVWMRMVRAGNVYTVYSSTDGITWTLYPASNTGGEEIANPWTRTNLVDPIYLGFAVTSHAVGALATAKFDSVAGFGASWQAANGNFTPKTAEGWANPIEDTTFTWQKAPLGPCGATYKIFAGEAADALGEIATTTDTQFTVAKNTLIEFNKTYFWRIDTVYGTETEEGNVWTFDAVKQKPTIVTQPAALTVVNGGATVNLNCLAHTTDIPALVAMVKYEWFQGATKVFEGVPADDGTGNLNFNCPLVLNNVQLASEGLYTCKITNTAGDVTSAAARVLTHRLMVWLKFDGNINDSAQNPTTPEFAPATGKAPVINGFVTGKDGQAIDLAGGSTDPNRAYVNVGKFASELGISGKLPRTVSVWAFTRGYANGGLFDIGAYGNGLDFSLRTLDSTDNRWRIQYWGGDFDFTTTSKNVWTHFAHIFDGTVTTIVANGVEIVSWTGPTLNTPDTNPLGVGAYYITKSATTGWYSSGNVFNGLLDDFRLYNYALTSMEAAKLFTDISGETVCVKPLAQDLTQDCKVDLADFAEMALRWLNSNVVSPK